MNRAHVDLCCAGGSGSGDGSGSDRLIGQIKEL